MVTITFSSDSQFDLPGYGTPDVNAQNEGNLRQAYFLREICVNVDGIQILHDKSYPLLDLLFTLLHSLKEVRETGHGTIDFVDSSKLIHVERNGQRLKFSTSPLVRTVECGHTEYAEAVHAFVEAGVADLTRNHPGLQSHPALPKLRGLLAEC
ncbi:hypothetical protein [Streptomyces clavuligerus]|uniref:hypothetical protein n=1 Tax=Streptomyces clavuligerus TaxID=1901 RepID=UPI00017FF8AE|nr:hypothetical protein [Streptomyces clavuligerus]ANW22624.1 hypothetical protein BB341_30435 [Streptomyces clavuligerus]AXU17484.1 hypothetical protein D1794_33605 [Streptomyces clavuligerus]EDY48683.1 hypothetical protein SSCG_01711 [Streptomyces clavuligerus]MBY6301015.1 hypothetical protein [Streptomyces clavuligerus]QPJ96982.1 hypothetical protein GE265_28075 [Streptomyces clavuligerus]